MKMNMYSTPSILKETCNGYSSISILADFMAKREIYCMGQIDTDSASNLILQLKHLEIQDPDAEITIYINSPGGVVSDCLAIYDIMQTISCPIRTVCIGTAASCGAILFAAGDTREMLPHSQVMIHDPLIAGEGLTGSANHLSDQIQNLMNTRAIIGEILAKHTGKTLDEILEKTGTDTWFTAKEALQFGLADYIIQPKTKQLNTKKTA